jgi:hypothetical protein
MSEPLPDLRQGLVRHVFADATTLSERLHAFASTGQSAGLSPGGYLQCAKRLESAAKILLALAQALPVLICPGLGDDGADDD